MLNAALEAMPSGEVEEAAALLSALVAIPSITLAEDEPAPDEAHGEARMAAFVARFLEESGLAPELEEVKPGRPQVTARLGSGSPELLVTAHLDTVEPVDWPDDPFTARREAERLVGLGACDVKGTLAAMLLAVRGLARAREHLQGTLTFIAMVGEETFGVGSRHLMRQGYRPDAAVVAEPTELRLVRVECGNVRWRFHTLGRAAHGSRPWEGESAIYRMADALRLLRDEVAPEIHARSHPLTGRAALNVGLIEGGRAVNIVPDRCSATIERRVLPGEDPLAAMEAVNRRLRELLGEAAVEFDAPLAVNHPVDTPEDAPVCRALAEALRSAALDPEPAGVTYGSDANRLAAAGVPCVIFGAGSILQAHTRDEWIDLRQVALAARILQQVADGFFKFP